MRTDEAATDRLPAAAEIDATLAIIPEQLSVVSQLSVDEQLSCLMDLLVAVRVHLTTGIMPRAARITGTSDRLYGAVDHVDAAIRVTKNVVTQLQDRT